MKLIPLTRGMFAQVDDADFEFVNQFLWQASPHKDKFTAKGFVNGKTVSMHRLLMGFPAGTVDHRNCDELDNQRHNLRVATHSQNQANRSARTDCVSGFKGVCLRRGRFRRKRPWEASFSLNYKRYHCGYYETPEEAATAYALYTIAAHGEFARCEPGQHVTQGEQK